LVELAYKGDPRIKKQKEEERGGKKEKKKRESKGFW
jgi:hypothetical protein